MTTKLSPKLQSGDHVLIIRGVRRKHIARVIDCRYSNSVILEISGTSRRIWKMRNMVALLGRATCR